MRVLSGPSPPGPCRPHRARLSSSPSPQGEDSHSGEESIIKYISLFGTYRAGRRGLLSAYVRYPSRRAACRAGLDTRPARSGRAGRRGGGVRKLRKWLSKRALPESLHRRSALAAFLTAPNGRFSAARGLIRYRPISGCLSARGSPETMRSHPPVCRQSSGQSPLPRFFSSNDWEECP